MLETAVHPVPALCQVKIQSNQHVAHGKNDLTFEQYCGLLQSAAIQLDSEHHAK